MKRSQLFLGAIALPLDYGLLLLAGLAAYRLRFVPIITQNLPVRFDIPLVDFMPTLLLVALVWVALLALAGLYTLTHQPKLSQEIARVFLGCTAGFAAVVLAFFFNPQLFGSRFIILAGYGLAFGFVTLGRLGLRLVRTVLYRHGRAATRLLVIGADSTTQALVAAFRKHPGFGFAVVREYPGLDARTLEREAQFIDEVVVGDPSLPREQYLAALTFCLTHHLGFRYAADMFDSASHNVVTHTYGGVPLIEIRRTPLDGWGRVLKRIFDVAVAAAALVLLSPVLILLAVLVMVSSGWPPLVALPRVGESGRVFRLFKYRSMVVGADRLKPQLAANNERGSGPLFKMERDPRVTNFGKFLRRTSLDELPQLLNVLSGSMSLVGPRPHEPGEVQQYEALQRKLLNIKPGITGLAQVSGRSNLSFADEAKLDTFYVENWSPWQDIVILVKTVVVVLQGQAAV